MAAESEKEILLPLFPLPNVVFYPHTRMPLHIFEPRYRQLISDVLDADQRFGIVLPRAGWEADYYGRPPLHEYGTMGTIEQALPLDDGRFNILIRGDVRFRIVGETSHLPYRIARVVEVPETPADATEAYAQRQWLAELSRQYLHYLPKQDSVPEIDTVGLDALTNALIMSLNLDVEQKQRLLEVDDLLERAEQVGTELQSRIESLQFLHPFRREGDPTRN
jgi:Lon protease-like protein